MHLKENTKMTEQEKTFLDRINNYANEALADIDPQKVQVSVQLERLKPVMEELASETGMPLEDVFIKYMDLASLVLAKKDEKFKSDMQDLGVMEFK